MDRELRAVARAMGLRRGRAATAPAWVATGVVAARVGVGGVYASTRTAALIDVLHPRAVLIAGVAGAIDPTLDVGDVIVPVSVLDAATGSSYDPTPEPGGELGNARRRGVLVTVAPGAVGAPNTPRTPRSAHSFEEGRPGDRIDGAAAVDMETSAIAAVCAARAVPWDVVRAISDLPGTVTPEVAALVRADGRADPVAAIRLLVREPREVVRLARLAWDTRRALGALGTAVRAELERRGAYR